VVSIDQARHEGQYMDQQGGGPRKLYVHVNSPRRCRISIQSRLKRFAESAPVAPDAEGHEAQLPLLLGEDGVAYNV
jgi:hypothetical protein